MTDPIIPERSRICRGGLFGDVIERQQRKKQLGYPICFFEIRIPGKNKTLNAKLSILLQPSRHGFRVSYQRGTGAAPDQTDSSPKIRTNFKPIPFAVVK